MISKILLVDDEQDVLEFMKYNLEKEGFWVYTSTNGADGIQLAKKIKPHLIVLDLMMPYQRRHHYLPRAEKYGGV